MLEILISEKVVGPIVIITAGSLIYLFINRIIKKIVKTKLNNTDAKRKKTLMSLINNLIKYFLLVIVLLMILSIYGIDTTALVTSLGVVGLIAGLALQDTLKDFLSGITIILENQYGIGDTVTINSFKGEVLSIGIKTTKLKAYNGEIKFIANRNIVEVINHSLSSSLAIVSVSISYNDDIKKVENILLNLCERLTKELDFLKGEVTLLGVDSFSSIGLVFKITVETETLKHFEVQRKILREIKLELDENKIEIPYDQMVDRSA